MKKHSNINNGAGLRLFKACKLAMFLILCSFSEATAQVNSDCVVATPITQTVNFCSSDGQYSVTDRISTEWFKFIATGFDINISVSGLGAGGTLPVPQISLYSDCSGDELVGTGLSSGNITSFYKGGLVIGATYYVKVSGINNASGTFKLCINNYDPVIKAGQDCVTASFLCSTQTISVQNVTGAGNNDDEAKGTCLSVPGQVSESNSAWYKWESANNGTLVFTITPTNTKDDIDWVLYDLGTTGDCSGVTPANAIRCKAGYGVSNATCPHDTVYFKTGLDFNETDVSEPPGCGHGQNGKLKFVTMEQGHIYALLINNFSSGNNGFSLAFADQHGKSGTGIFIGPKPVISYTGVNDCTKDQQYTFTSNSSAYTTLKWLFGNGASIATAETPGPFTITYSTPGIKTITLEATASDGCSVIAMQQITVGIKPPLPVIMANKTSFCVNDTVKLTANADPNSTYSWSGPNNFKSDSAVAVLIATGNQIVGEYKLVVNTYGCTSDTASLELRPPMETPIAAFNADPEITNVLSGPVTVSFINNSLAADTYLWNFGDGSSSTLKNPVHVYNSKGNFNVTLTAYKINSCSNATVKYNIVVIQNNETLIIPNAFTPNGDGINDLFNVTGKNIEDYHIWIYTRWGQIVFESLDIRASWDGTYLNKRVPTGTYYFVIKAFGVNTNALKRAGYITLIR